MGDLSDITVCVECGGRVALKDHGGRRKWYRGAEVSYPRGLLIPTCETCGAEWVDGALNDALGESFEQQRAAKLQAKTG